MQRRAVRTIVGTKNFDHSIYIYSVQLFMFKYHQGVWPPVFKDLFLSNMNLRSHFTRQYHNLHVSLNGKTILSKTVRVTGVALYNNFNSHLSMGITYDSYEYNLRKFIHDHDISNVLQYDVLPSPMYRTYTTVV